MSSEDLQSLFENRDSSNTKQCVEAAKREYLTSIVVQRSWIAGDFLKNTKEEVAESLIQC